MSLLSIASTSANAADQTPISAQQLAIEKNIENWLEQHDVPAAAVAYIADGSLQWSGVYGEQSPGVNATPNTLFNIASMTKSISAEVILRLVSSGQINLDEQMSVHWVDPDIARDSRHQLLTPEMALRHRAGFPNWRVSNGGLAFQFTPGAKASYSGEGYDYVARFAEKKLNQSFTALAHQEIFKPLGMAQVSYVGEKWFRGRVAQPLGPEGKRRSADVRDNWSAADDVHITIRDYAKFLMSVMKDEGVSKELAAQRFKLADNIFANGCPWGPDSCPKKGGFGMGWAVFEYEGETVIMHGGGDWGERTLGFFVPEREIGLTIFTNGANGSAIIKKVVEVLYPNSDYIAFLAFQARQ